MTHTLRIELIYDHDSPNAEPTRQQLAAVCGQLPGSPPWTAWERADLLAPPYVQRYGSPTILVNGVDVGGQPPTDAPCCRIYRDANGKASGVPSKTAIEYAIVAAQPHPAARSGVLGAAAAVGLAVLPVAICPACWPAWLGVFAALGLGFLASTVWQVSLLGMAALLMAWGVWRRRSPWRSLMILAIVAAWAACTAGKFLTVDWATWTGAALFAVVGIMHGWVSVRSPRCAC